MRGPVRGPTRGPPEGLLAVSSFLARLLQPKGFTWFEVETLAGRFDHGLPSFERRNLSPDFIQRSGSFGGIRSSFDSERDGDRCRFGRALRRSSGRLSFPPRANPKEIMNPA